MINSSYKFYIILSFIIYIINTLSTFAQTKETNYFCTEDFTKNYSLKKFKQKIDEGIDVNEKCNWSEMPALFRIFYTIKDKQALDILEKTNADFNYIEQKLDYSRGRTLLFSAVQGNLVRSIPFLIRKGVNVNGLEQGGDSPLLRHCMSTSGKFKIFEELVRQGANINHTNLKGDTCLKLALEFNRNHKKLRKIFMSATTKELKNCKEKRERDYKKIKCPTILYLSLIHI